MLMYNDRFALRGEKPIRSQSTSLSVVGLLYLTLPKPMIELPQIFGSSPVAFFIISKITKLSLRFCSSLTLMISSHICVYHSKWGGYTQLFCSLKSFSWLEVIVFKF